MEEFKYVCKLCSKRFPSGKSLGGHMRSHAVNDAKQNKLIASSSKKVANFANENDEFVEFYEVDNENGGSSSKYGLRENPKKTWRIVNNSNKLVINNNNNNNNEEEQKVCKQCGKGFQSLKALCGHMSIHKDKHFFKDDEDDYSWSSDSKDPLFLPNESDNDNKNSKRRQAKASLSRYEFDGKHHLNTTSTKQAVQGNSDIDKREQEEVAKCLMMLSRDSSGSMNGYDFEVVSSDNSSVIVVSAGKGKNENVMMEHEVVNSDSDETGAKKIESDDSFDGIAKKNYGFEIESRLIDCFGEDHDFTSKRKARNVSSFSPNSDENYPSKKVKQDDSENVVVDSLDSNIYECWICNKTYRTHQALGGHILSHTKDGDNDLDTSNLAKVNKGKNVGCSTASSSKKGSSSKKANKGYKCPYCPKVFKSGQALGGHKRSHMMIGSSNVVLHSEERVNHIPVVVSQPPEPEERVNDIPVVVLPPEPEERVDDIPVVVAPPEPEVKQPVIDFDLNLPAPLEEGDDQFMGW